MLAILGPSKEQLKDWGDYFEAQEKIEDINVQAQREELRRKAARATQMAGVEGGSEEEIAQRAYDTRVKLAVDLGNIEAARIAKEEDANKKSVLAAQAQKDLFGELAQAQDQFDEKKAQIEQKRIQELQSQIDALQKRAEKLIDVLFTKPRDFGKDLLKTIHEEALKPVVSGFSSVVANVMHPVMYGDDGKGGLAGIFKGLFGGGKGADPVTTSTNKNTDATRENTAHIAALTAMFAGLMGVPAPVVAAPTVGGVSLPSISVAAPAISPSVAAITSMAFGGGSAGGFAGGGGGGGAVAGGAPYTAAQLANLPLNHDPVMQMLSLAMGGKLPGAPGAAGAAGGGGFASILSNLKGSVFNEKAFHSLPIDQTTGMGQFESGAYGVATSPAASAAGMMLATSGLLGSHMGTWGGVGMGTVGGGLLGAGIGQQIGGPDRRAHRRGHRRIRRIRHRPGREASRHRDRRAEGARRYQEHLRRRHSAEQRDDQAGCEHRQSAVWRRYRGGRAVAQRPATRPALLRSHRPEDASLGGDAVRRKPRGAGRQSLSAGDLPEQRVAHLCFESAHAGRNQRHAVSHDAGSEHERRGGDVRVAQHQRDADHRGLHRRSVHGGAERELWTNPAVGQPPSAGPYGGVIQC